MLKFTFLSFSLALIVGFALYLTSGNVDNETKDHKQKHTFRHQWMTNKITDRRDAHTRAKSKAFQPWQETQNRVTVDTGVKDTKLNSPDKVCVVNHGVTEIQVPCNAKIFSQRAVPENATVFEVTEFPDDKKLRPEIGNGHIATVIHGDSIYMNGLYNGAATKSHRARIASTVAVNITSVSLKGTKMYIVDMGRGVYYEYYQGDDFYVELRMYAHRVLTRLLVVELIIGRDGEQPVTVDLKVNSGAPSEDIDFKTDNFAKNKVSMHSGTTKEAEYPAVAPVTPVTVLSTDIPSSISIPAGVSKTDMFFLTSISVSKSEAIDYFKEGMNMIANQTLFSSHVDAWSTTWEKGRIDVEGNLTISRITYASLYYLMSSLPLKKDKTWEFFGLAPGGLAHGGYNLDYSGHIFWDQDTWMFPPIMILHADIGRLLVNTRIRTLNSAKTIAKTKGYQGAMYPWESAFTGLETSPSSSCGSQEQHITGDISFAMRQYLMMTNDTDFLTKGCGEEAITNIATFWASRVVYNNSTKMYEILKVMPPDEYHENVNNSAYTNTVAQLSLYTAVYALRLLGKQAPPNWVKIAENMYIPFDSKLMYHPEYDGYTQGTTVKQADVVMLEYPLMSQDKDDQVSRNDLNVYEKVTPGGPAMTWAIFTTDWLELGDSEKAASLFDRTLVNAKKPFYIWTENADGSGATNFHTGMGGYLQTMIFGYGGFRMSPQQLVFNPNLPPSTTMFSITGLDYGGNSLDFVFDHSSMTVTTTVWSRPMAIQLYSTGVTHILELKKPLTFPRQKAALVTPMKKN